MDDEMSSYLKSTQEVNTDDNKCNQHHQHNNTKEEMKLSYLSQCTPIDIEFHDMSHSVPTGKTGSKQILHSISGQFKSGQLTAIMGPSGAGKSTLLNILAAYKISGSTGSILVNGECRNIRSFRKMSRYIMQEDVLQPLLTVEEQMFIAANLKLGSDSTYEHKETVIHEIMDLLSLTKTLNTRTEQLSGGEKKRLSIALELINNPSILFLDEPTTGLDDVSSRQCVKLLKTLAEGGRTIICSIHTPSAKLFATFDNVYVLANGYCTYQGYGPDVIQYLVNIGLQCPKHFNPADFVIEVCSGDYGDHMQNLIKESDNGRSMTYFKRNILKENINNGIVDNTPFVEAEISDGNNQYEEITKQMEGSTLFMQFKVLIGRMWLQMYRDKCYLLLRFFVAVSIASICGNVFIGMGKDGSKPFSIFLFYYGCVLKYAVTTLMPVLLSFPSDIQNLKRETFNKWYQLTPYFIALTLSTIPMTLLRGIIFVPITFFLIDQPLDIDRMFQFYFILMLSAHVSESFGHLISSHLNIVNSMFIGATVLAIQLFMSLHGMGYGVDTKISCFMEVLLQFNYIRHSLEGIMSTMMTNRELLDCPESEVICLFRDLDKFSLFINVRIDKYWINVLALSGMYILLRCASFYLLKQRLRPNKAFKRLKFLVKTRLLQRNG